MAFVIEFIVVLPYEIANWGVFYGLVVGSTGIWFFVNINYHLFACYLAGPGHPEKSMKPELCTNCQNHKPVCASHCSTCKKCILRMDHHCFFLNGCVGLKNHRHFILFLAFLAGGSFFGIVAGSSSVWNNLIWRTPEAHFCFIPDTFALLSILQPYMCLSPEFSLSTFFIILGLTLLVCGFAMGLIVFLWQAPLISFDTTHLNRMKQQTRPTLVMALSPINRDVVKRNWERFLGINKPGRSFLRHVLLPHHDPPMIGDMLHSE
ncbi:hypothetical protein L596_030600 [Steinernema carpocapsae]|uniref:Palmitoyltransferase n=2 Tax=Steinernema carpocapsae TaxID=34508 RepID=A0A4U5LPV5_STECR|nr:hypothetical protein L596_030600 [Steinernema carpocapsae]